MTVDAVAATEGLVMGPDGAMRCWWAGSDPMYVAYHDREWGQPVGDDVRLFEKLCLEGFQAGLSWLTILRKRDGFRRAFDGFDPARVAAYGDDDVERLVSDAAIVRHRGKIAATIANARRYPALVEEFGSLAAFLWSHEPPPSERPPVIDHATLLTMATTSASTAISRALRTRGWSFVGATTMYALMQAMGLVDDHLEGCDTRPIVERERNRFVRPRPG